MEFSGWYLFDLDDVGASVLDSHVDSDVAMDQGLSDAVQCLLRGVVGFTQMGQDDMAKSVMEKLL